MVEPVRRLLLTAGENQVRRALLHVVRKDADCRLLGFFVAIAKVRLGGSGPIRVAVGGYLANFLHTRVPHVDLSYWILNDREVCHD